MPESTVMELYLLDSISPLLIFSWYDLYTDFHSGNDEVLSAIPQASSF